MQDRSGPVIRTIYETLDFGYIPLAEEAGKLGPTGV